MSQIGGVPSYHYDQTLGDPNVAFTPAAEAHPEAHRPEFPAKFVANVDGETLINTMWGKRKIPWHARPGTPCVILGYWADGTVQLRWPAIRGAYRVEGRFPGWVVEEDPTARMAGGGRILLAHNPDDAGPGFLARARASIGRLFRDGPS
jgi:hypothetical protein